MDFSYLFCGDLGGGSSKKRVATLSSSSDFARFLNAPIRTGGGEPPSPHFSGGGECEGGEDERAEGEKGEGDAGGNEGGECVCVCIRVYVCTCMCMCM